MGLVNVVIQLALFFVFSINCKNTTAVYYPLNQELFLTKIDTECLAYHYVPCRKGMTPMTVIFEDEEMDDPNLSESNDTIKYDFQCISYQLIPCQKVSKNLILKVVDEQERLRQTRSIYSKRLENCEENRNTELFLLAKESYCLTSRSTESEISQLISLENMKMCNEKEESITQQLNVTENEKFVLQRDKIALTDRLDQSEIARKRSDENMEVCKGLAANLIIQLADCEMEDGKTKEKIKATNGTKNQLGLREEFNDETKFIYNYIAKAFTGTPFTGNLDNYTFYQMGRMRIMPKPNIQPLAPQNGTVFNDVTSIRYNLAIPSCKNSADSRSVFIAVVSAPENFQNRENIRQTWKNHVNLVQRNGVLGTICTIEFAFVLGPAKNRSTQISNIEESTKYKDIIQISDMEDFPSYMTMPGIINWIYSRCPQIEFLFKVEDDMYVNVHKLAYYVRDFYQFGNNANMAIYSQKVDESINQQNKPKPKRSGDKMVALDEWPWDTYPYYFDGPAYLMHKSTILPLLAAIQTTPVYFLEEVYITGICGDKAGLNKKIGGGVPLMWPWASKTVNNTCDVNMFLSWKNTVSYISHEEIDAFYSGQAPNPSCDYKKSENFPFFRFA
ncbi:hypothetical protein DAPPUDRAFT_227096 [Daphnia pulex]|uniref:Hexosyltransferase n=1 Tax=Daphnia pulex TaxID=6669 RepID=E9H3X1_DAPPU|nr:hypothetical protein DAPPUDRAFT_227096 [Daphnia pulex]|eukprot:EFX73644.1 hypothetical protein DAPPUDRAFT_227096 [Daphnia pulex]